jgi:hypothetical protein
MQRALMQLSMSPIHQPTTTTAPQESAADAEALQPLVEQVAWGDLAAERAQGAAAANLRQLVAVGQGVLDLLRAGAAGSGALLVSSTYVGTQRCGGVGCCM